MSIRVAPSISVAVTFLVAVPRAQNAPAQVPTFRSGVRLLQIDAVVQ